MREIKEIASSIRELSWSYKEVGNTMNGVNNDFKPLKKLIGNPDLEGKGKGSRLIAAGIACIAFPDPTISDVVGVSLIVAGMMKNKMKQPTAADMYRNFQDVMKELRDIRREMALRR